MIFNVLRNYEDGSTANFVRQDHMTWFPSLCRSALRPLAVIKLGAADERANEVFVPLARTKAPTQRRLAV
jgi:hypothetical protein